MANELESFKVAGKTVQDTVLSLIQSESWTITDSALRAFEELRTEEFGKALIIPFSRRIYDIDMYLSFRKARRGTTRPNGDLWPEELSRKEVVLCKIDMISTLFALHKAGVETNNNTKDYVERLIEDIKRSVYKWKWDKDKPKERWPGLDPDAATILNTLYKSFKNSNQLI